MPVKKAYSFVCVVLAAGCFDDPPPIGESSSGQTTSSVDAATNSTGRTSSGASASSGSSSATRGESSGSSGDSTGLGSVGVGTETAPGTTGNVLPASLYDHGCELLWSDSMGPIDCAKGASELVPSVQLISNYMTLAMGALPAIVVAPPPPGDSATAITTLDALGLPATGSEVFFTAWLGCESMDGTCQVELRLTPGDDNVVTIGPGDLQAIVFPLGSLDAAAGISLSVSAVQGPQARLVMVEPEISVE